MKPLLYVYRVLLTGIRLMRTGEVQANLKLLNEESKLPYIHELIERTIAPCRLIFSKVKPVPPPVWWMMAASVAVFMMPAMESGTSSTKQAASCPEGLPALTRHGVFGTNSRRSMMPAIVW